MECFFPQSTCLFFTADLSKQSWKSVDIFTIKGFSFMNIIFIYVDSWIQIKSTNIAIYYQLKVYLNIEAIILLHKFSGKVFLNSFLNQTNPQQRVAEYSWLFINNIIY